MNRPVLALTAGCALALCLWPRPRADSAEAAPSAGPVQSVPRAEANDNRSPAGVRRDGALEIALVVTEARWYPEADSGPSEVVQAFAEEGEPPRIPGPLIRVPAGTEIRARVRNALSEDRVTLYGFHARPGSPDDSLHIDPGASRQVSFVTGEPGTYFYWGTTTGLAFDPEHPREEDSQLHGALVVDPPGATGPPRDRVFVIGAWSAPADSAGPPPIVPRDVMTINGKSWPHTERIHLTAGDTVRWRWLNPSVDAHPMHLHGFFFQVMSRGTWAADTLYRAGQSRMAVTELMLPGGTMTMEWVPEEPGNWLFHCHFSFHVSHFLSLEKVPDPADPLGPEAPDHTVEGMRGMILGITVEPRASGERRPEVYGGEARRIRLLVQSAPGRYGEHEGLGYLVHEGGAAPSPDSVPTMSPALVLRRGEPVNITIVNRLRAPTGVHWHGMELPSYPDGVPGWSGTPGRLAPPITPGDSFVAAFTPPRAGTFIYHSHSNEGAQIASGLFGPLIVADPEQGYDPERERLFVVGGNGPVNSRQGRVNGQVEPDTMRLTAGRTYRLRLININPDWRVYLSLKEGDEPLEWRALAKDGADLPPGQALRGPARILMGPGETADFAFTPERAGEAALEVATQLEGWTVGVPIRVSVADGSGTAPPGGNDRGRTGDAHDLVQDAPASGGGEGLRECALSAVSLYHETFSRGDAEARAAFFTEDAVWFNAFGGRRAGRKAIHERWEGLLSSGTFSQARIDILGTTTHELSPTLIMIDQVNELTGQRTPGPEGRAHPPRHVHLTFVVEQRDGSCLIAYYRAGDLRNYPKWTPPAEPADVPTRLLADYEGRDVSEARGDTVEVRLDDGSLWAVFEDGEIHEMVPISETWFRVPPIPHLFEFIRDEGGAVTSFRIHRLRPVEERFARIPR